MYMRERRRTPSFSSTLLDSIYHSIDQEELDHTSTRAAMNKKKQSHCSISKRNVHNSLERAIMIESWMEKQYNNVHPFNSTSSSSDSSSGGLFSSSETEPIKEKLTVSSGFRFEKPHIDMQQNSKREGGFTKTKLRALRIYDELKKSKQPISPGGRITSFLNSIFSSGNAKKVNLCSVGTVEDVEDVSYERKSKSACNSASSFSRSCLSKTPTSRAKQSNVTKRTVRFYPVSVIVGEDSQPCGHKSIYESNPQSSKTNAGKSVEKALMEKKNVMNLKSTNCINSGNEYEDDEGESCASSDLFELDHLIGIGRYREELPVYETTNFKTNFAIANGLIL